ncbi:MAG: 4-hydroxythreonine-4-phosphate dehydrogenase PdxA [Muribaculaceae bacterium]|nr:4-hydroxythreonine-4-phosphate dehydrogenase PdxA [Muribaculaceae bacterium]
MAKHIRVGITQGDINGIGYEIILKTLEDTRMLELCTPVVYGSAKIASFYRKLLEMPQIPFTQIDSADQIQAPANYIINVVGEDVRPEPGVPSKSAGEAALAALERAVADLKEEKIDILVTAPINKQTIHGEGFDFPGHTEYLQATAGEGEAMMIMASEVMRVALATIHVPVQDIPSLLTTESITEKICSLAEAVKSDFGVVKPRIAVLALNPHAGDGGVIGTEEQEVIIPAINAAKNKKVQVYGPYPADGFFGSENYTRFDAILAMYHDQGLVPFKALVGDQGVNVTAGLPFVRTSPDHGTAFDIAGKGVADPESFRRAIYMGIDIWRNRRNHAEMTANPLRKQYFDRSKDNVVLDLTKD